MEFYALDHLLWRAPDSVALATERLSQTLTQQILEETLQTTFLGRQEMIEAYVD